MFSQRGIEKLTGLLLILTMAAVLVSVITYAEPIDTASDAEIRETLIEIDKDSGLFLVSVGFLIVAGLLAIPLAAGLYSTFREHDQTLALLGSFGFLAWAIFQSVSAMVLFAMETLAQDFVAASGTGVVAQQTTTIARTIGEMGDVAFPMGAMGVALGVLGYGALVARSGALPRWMGAVGIVAAVIIPFGWLRFAEERLEGIIMIGLLGGLLFALMAGFQLVTKGANEPDSSR